MWHHQSPVCFKGDQDKIIYSNKCQLNSNSIPLPFTILTVCSGFCGHQISELELKRKSPSFLAAFLWGTPPFGQPPSEFWAETELSDDALNKNGCACVEINFLCICTTFVILTSILNVLTYLIKLLFYSGYQFMHCTVLYWVKKWQCFDCFQLWAFYCSNKNVHLNPGETHYLCIFHTLYSRAPWTLARG